MPKSKKSATSETGKVRSSKSELGEKVKIKKARPKNDSDKKVPDKKLKTAKKPVKKASIKKIETLPAKEPVLPVVKAIPDEVINDILGKKPVVEASASDDANDLARLNDDEIKLTPKIRISRVSDLSSAVQDYANKSMYDNDYVVDLKSKRNFYVDDADDLIDEEIQAILGQPIGDISKPGQPSVEDAFDLSMNENDHVKEGLKQELLEAISGSAPDASPIIDESQFEETMKSKEAEKQPEAPVLEEVPEEQAPVVSDLEALVRKQHNLKIFKRIAVAFSIIVVLVLVGVLYFVTVKTSISITLKEEQLSDKMLVQIYDRPTDFALPEKSLRGVVKKIDMEQSKLFQVGGSEVIGEEVVGQITLFNKYNKSQPLVASTRLLSASGKLFRLKNAVTVPAGSSVKVDVYADQSKQDQVIGAELFTVPGLWEGIQDKIYGESSAGSIKYQQKLRRIISQNDIDKALSDLKQVVIDRVKADTDNTYNDYDYKIYQLDQSNLEYKPSGKIGDEQEQLPMSLKGSVQVVAFTSAQALELVKNQVSAKLLAGQELVGLVSDSVNYEVTRVDPTTAMAEISIGYSAKIKPSGQSNVIDKSKIIGLSDSQLIQYLKGLKQVQSFTVDYNPRFIKQVPRLADRIEIKIIQ